MSTNILMIVIKGNATLDYATPLLWKISAREKNANISVLYCSISRNTILKNASYYSKVYEHCDILEYDFADFIQGPFRFLKGTWRTLLSESNWDSVGWKRFLDKLPFGNHISSRVTLLLKSLDIILSKRVSFEKILPHFNPDVVLFDNRTTTNFHGRNRFYDCFAQQKPKIVLLPHAPLHSGTYAMIPFDEKGEDLPDYCDYWMPYKYERTSELIPQQKDQFAYVGYPGMDSEWIKWLQSYSGIFSDNNIRNSENSTNLKCLFVIRKFRDYDDPLTDFDDYRYSYDEFMYYLNLVKSSLADLGQNVDVIVKPHPSNSMKSLKGALKVAGIKNWKIMTDSLYSALNEIDFIISLYSTAPFTLAASGIPVVWLNSRVQSVAHRDEMKPELFSGFEYYLDDPENLRSKLPELIGTLKVRSNEDTYETGHDSVHIRKFYPDGALQRCLKRLEI